ncbi:MAG: YczE/YyaS/YitT family protein [bacterium]
MRKRILSEWLQIAAGLGVFSFGVHLTIFANIGLAPWDCLGMGIAAHTRLNYGLSMTLMALAILGIDLLLRERIGFGTLLDALLTGNFVQLWNDLNPFPLNEKVLPGVLLMLAGFVFMALGMLIYMKAAQCCGPRDSLLVGLGKRLPRVPIGVVEILLWSAVVLAGCLLGGPVGIGTLLSTVGGGAVMQVVYSLLRFEPREIQHRSIPEVAAAWRGVA